MAHMSLVANPDSGPDQRFVPGHVSDNNGSTSAEESGTSLHRELGAAIRAADELSQSPMITNEAQYRATKAHLRQFDDALANLEAKAAAPKRSKVAQLEIDAVRAQAEDLRAEIDEYDRLRSGTVSTFEAASLADLATLLVKARIARGWSQRRLTETLGVAEQQVQRYESTGYRSASLARICDVATALDVIVTERAELRGPNAA